MAKSSLPKTKDGYSSNTVVEIKRGAAQPSDKAAQRANFDKAAYNKDGFVISAPADFKQQ